MRPLLLVAVSAALLSPVAAGPASAKSCNLVSDKPNDAYLGLSTATPSVNALDIRSVDVASGAKTLVVVLRVGSTDGKAEQTGPAGMTWRVEFLIGDVKHVFTHTLSNAAGGASYSDAAKAGDAAIGGLKVAVTPTSITWTVPRSAVPKLKKRGVAMTAFFGSTSSPVAHDYAPDNAAPSPARYVDRSSSCVRAP